METRYNSGQAVLVPAVITSAEERNGQVIYHVEANLWEGVPEEQIVIDPKVTARAAFNDAMMELSRQIGPRY